MSNDTDTFTVKITNQCHPTKKPTRHDFTIAKDSTVKDLIDKIVEEVKYEKNYFVMKVNLAQEIPTETEEDLKKEIAAYCNTEKGTVVIGLNRPPNLELKDLSKTHPIYDTPSHDKQTLTLPPAQSSANTTSTYTGSSGSSFSAAGAVSTYSWNTKSDTGYCGLSNQGATCYLNSLLQTLYMTPEFRNALYNWSFDDWCRAGFEVKLKEQQEKEAKEKEKQLAENPEEVKKEEEVEKKNPDEMYEEFRSRSEQHSIPRQLQKLFLRLNTSDKRAVDTKSLTKSFGWGQDDAFTQHDVQELCRVLFDALETVWKGTEQANLINDFYQGTMKDYVQCKCCGTESSRSDKYLDIPLVIRGFGQTTPVKSIVEGLEKFIEPETLEGENQYFCEKCKKKNDASKGLKFIDFPYLLTLQLKRFDFDFQTMRRIKLNDRVSFPEILDLNRLLSSSSKKLDDFVEAGDELDNRQQLIDNALANGPYVYELYSILIHRGSALGGHYYAYIRSFKSGKWSEFNDSSVKEIPIEQLKETFGEGEKKSFFSSGTNAYMLMYRQFDPKRNEEEPTKDSLPESIRELIEAENKKEEEKEAEKQRLKSLVPVKVTWRDKEKEFKFEKTVVVQEALEQIVKEMGAESLWPNNLRFRDTIHFGVPVAPLSEDDKKKTLGDYCPNAYQYNPKHLLIECKNDQETFSEFNRMDTVLKVSFFEEETQTWSAPYIVSAPPKYKNIDLKNMLKTKTNIPVEEMLLTKDDFPQPKKLQDHRDVMSDMSDGSKVFVERAREGKEEPRAIEEITRRKNAVEAVFNTPGEKEYKHKVLLDKRMTILSLKKIIESKTNLSIDELKIYKVYSETYKYELRNEEELIGDAFVTAPKVFVEKGKPMRAGEIPCKWHLYDLETETKTELFELALPGKLTLKEIKQELTKYWNSEENNNNPNKKKITLDDPTRLRIRSVYGSRPASIYSDDKTLKDVTGRTFGVADVYIQILPEGKTETKTSDDIVVIVLRQFNPETYQLGPLIEFEANKEEKLAEIQERISNVTNIPSRSLSFSFCDSYDIQKVLEIPNLKWYHKPREEGNSFFGKKSKLNNSVEYESDKLVRSLNILDGEYLLYRDIEVQIKKLSEEEEKKIKEEEEKKRNTRMRQQAFYRKEEKLDIKIADVSLSGEQTPNIKK
eukprot:TRINITY_DN1987_c0_g1_i1.p1 TRINITY_DN1987_c0_g1~~TRINITY_DN1987_c0_g1_i1.p1  ORF type:complete len:1184 (-),score=304.19 TRINITY_DN1987_c0_g1_i1:63-3557(-)